MASSSWITSARSFAIPWNEEIGGRAAGLSIVEEAKRVDFDFPSGGLPSARHRLTKGAAYPIFAAFRNLVASDPETGDAYWVPGEDGIITYWRADDATHPPHGEASHSGFRA